MKKVLLSILFVSSVIMLKAERTNSLYQLNDLDIKFTDIYGEAFFSDEELEKEKNNPLYVSEISTKIINDLIVVAQSMRESGMKHDRLKEGAYQGEDLFDAMEKTKKVDVESFLNYMLQKPTKYQNNTWKFSEIYATWLDGGMPTNPDERIMDLYVMNNDLEIFEHLLKYETKERNLAYFDYWEQGVNKFMAEEQYSRADSWNQGMIHIAEYYEDEELISDKYFDAGYICQGWGEYICAIEAYKKAHKHTKDKNTKAIIHINMAISLNSNKQYKDGLYFLKKSRDHLEKVAKDKMDKPEIKSVLALAYSNMGLSYAGLNDNSKAIKEFARAETTLEDCQELICLKGLLQVYVHLVDFHTTEKNKKEIEKYNTKLEQVLTKYQESLDE